MDMSSPTTSTTTTASGPSIGRGTTVDASGDTGRTCGGNSIMILIHKLYVERLRSYLMHRCCSCCCDTDDRTSLSSNRWTVINHHSEDSEKGTSDIINSTIDDHNDDDDLDQSNDNPYFSWQIVHTPIVTGASQARRGYVLVYIAPTAAATTTAFRQYLYDASPMIRKNISCIYPIQYQSTITTTATHDADDVDNMNDIYERIGTLIWSTLFSSEPLLVESSSIPESEHRCGIIRMNDLVNVLLRVDCYHEQGDVPNLLQRICQHLQYQCGTALENCRKTNATATTQPMGTSKNTNYSNREDDTSKSNNATGVIDHNHKNYCNCDPFDGPIPMTMSKSKCTHKLSIVVIPNNDTSSSRDGETIHNVYWGIECRCGNNNRTTTTLMIDLPLNHDAANEIVVVPGIDQHHQDIHRSKKTKTTAKLQQSRLVTSIVPLSRAYYKLHEIWYTYLLQPPENKTFFQQFHNNANVATSAIDLGAAPGGWTQVLLNHMNVSYVLAIDRAQLAHRDRFVLPQCGSDSSTDNRPTATIKKHIFHVPSTMENLNLQEYYENCRRHQCVDHASTGSNHPTTDGSIQNDITAVLLPPSVFSYLVCDASVQWNLLLPMILHQLQQPNDMNVIQWTVPSAAIVTLKLPYKRIHSIRSHVLDIQKQVPLFLQRLLTIMYGNQKSTTISSRYRIIHCMANSESERTLLAIFESP